MSFPNDVLLVLDGDIARGMWGLAEPIIAKDDYVIETSQFLTCVIVSDRHETYQTGIGRVAGGILGGVLLGGIGAAAGLLAGGKRRIDETIVLISLRDGTSFSAEVSPLTAAKIQQICQRNSIIKQERPSYPDNSQTSSQLPRAEDKSEIECPMCAETIKAKAKICRFCGYKIAEVYESFIQSLGSDESVLETLNFQDIFKRYVIETEEALLLHETEVLSIVECFSKHSKMVPQKKYRTRLDEVMKELDFPYRTPINEMSKKHFRFIREDNPFDVNGSLIIVRKSD